MSSTSPKVPKTNGGFISSVVRKKNWFTELIFRAQMGLLTGVWYSLTKRLQWRVFIQQGLWLPCDTQSVPTYTVQPPLPNHNHHPGSKQWLLVSTLVRIMWSSPPSHSSSGYKLYTGPTVRAVAGQLEIQSYKIRLCFIACTSFNSATFNSQY